MSVDTLSLAKELRADDFVLPQAEAIAAAIGRSVTETTATKTDLAQMGSELRTEIAQLSGEVRTEIAKLDTKIEAATSKLLFWFSGAQLGTGALIVALIRLLPAQG